MISPSTKSKKRIDLIDVYRGFAILGIFVVNITVMSSTTLNEELHNKTWTSNFDLVSTNIIELLFYFKFFPIFSFLFGLGISMQILKSKLPLTYFFRRMLILLLFGILHIVFLWSGDILHLYALIGLLTAFIIKKSNKLIISLSAFFLLFPTYGLCFKYIFNFFNYYPEIFLNGQTGETYSTIVKHGSYFEVLNLRLLKYTSNTPIIVGFFAPIAFSMALLGAYVGKNNIYLTLKTFIKRIKKPMLFMAFVSIIYRVMFLFFIIKAPFYSLQINHFILDKILVLCDGFMGIFYLWLIGWIWYYTKWKSLLLPLKYVGRMALTNYILQSIIGLIVFTSLGFKLYETLSPSETLLTAIGIFISQVFFSRLWLSYFQFGPLEWVWRCFTYKEFLPIKKSDFQL